MSGFEIAGIVLGTIPLLISALEHYHDGVSTMQRWRRYQRERQNLVRILRTEQIQLQNTCESLLEGLVSPSEVAAMIREPFSGKWRHRKIQVKLRARLHDSIDVFESIVEDVQAAMVELARRLGVDTTGKVGLFPLRQCFVCIRDEASHAVSGGLHVFKILKKGV